MTQLTPRTKAYLMVLAVTLVGAATCWFLLTQISKLEDDSEAIAALPVRHRIKFTLPEGLNSWKVYKNDGFGVEFAYPEDAIVQVERDSYITIKNPVNVGSYISTQKNAVGGYSISLKLTPPVTGRFDIEKWLDDSFAHENPLPYAEETFVAGKTAYFLANGPEYIEVPENTYIIPTSYGVYQIHYMNLSADSKEFYNNEKIIEQFLKAFKFTK